MDPLPRWPYRVVAISYPLVILLGKLASFTAVDSYFGKKTNLFNVFLVKQGWLWTSVVFWLAFAFRPRKSPSELRQTAIRFALATLWWIVFSQWLFGPPLMDRIFTLTGGSCTQAEIALNTSHACRKAGGTWTGGHDPSGHFFILVHSSLVLLGETLPLLATATTAEPFPLAAKIPLILVAIWTWMLLMTSIYFHSLFEKFTGLLFGYAEAYVVYYLGSMYSFGRFLGIPISVETAPIKLTDADMQSETL